MNTYYFLVNEPSDEIVIADPERFDAYTRGGQTPSCHPAMPVWSAERRSIIACPILSPTSPERGAFLTLGPSPHLFPGLNPTMAP
jgi:hypothetical protein